MKSTYEGGRMRVEAAKAAKNGEGRSVEVQEFQLIFKNEFKFVMDIWLIGNCWK